MELSIVIVNYRSQDKLINCLDSVARETAGQDREIIVVDNASGDDLSRLPAKYSGLTVVNSSRNLGMGGGNNLGIKQARGEFMLVLNPDTVVQTGAIRIMLSYLKDNPTAGLVGPKLIYPDGSLQSSCSRFPSFFMPVLRRTFLGDYFRKARNRFTMDDFDHDSIRPVDWLMGSCLMFRRQLALKDGRSFAPLFDERYFMYFEDTDLCRQIWENGFRVIYDPEAVVVHDHQRQSAEYPWYFAVFLSSLTRWHIVSWLKYFAKWGFKNVSYS